PDEVWDAAAGRLDACGRALERLLVRDAVAAAVVAADAKEEEVRAHDAGHREHTNRGTDREQDATLDRPAAPVPRLRGHGIRLERAAATQMAGRRGASEVPTSRSLRGCDVRPEVESTLLPAGSP